VGAGGEGGTTTDEVGVGWRQPLQSTPGTEVEKTQAPTLVDAPPEYRGSPPPRPHPSAQ
jgi:hypothetical protein